MRRPALAPLAALAATAAVSACGAPAASRDVGAFTRQGRTPAERAILHSIAIYRAGRDLRLACSLVTAHFLRIRFDGHEQECEYFSGQALRALPRSARVVSVAGGRARVAVHERTATRSIYAMALERGVWRIDDILPP